MTMVASFIFSSAQQNGARARPKVFAATRTHKIALPLPTSRVTLLNALALMPLRPRSVRHHQLIVESPYLPVFPALVNKLFPFLIVPILVTRPGELYVYIDGVSLIEI